MSHLLLLSYSLPPSPVGSASIVENLARQFSRSEMTLAGERPFGGAQLSWGPELPEIRHIQHIEPFPERGTRWWRRAQFPRSFQKILSLARESSAILSIFPNDSFLFAGWAAARILDKPFYSYFHNTYLENRTGAERRFAERLQPRVFKDSRHVFVMSDGMVDLYRERYPSLHCTALTHAFAEPMPVRSEIPAPRDPPHLVLMGSINSSCADAARRMAEVASTKKARVTLLTGTSKSDLAHFGVLKPGFEVKSLGRKDVLALLATADVLLLPHGLTGSHAAEEYRTIFPTRTIEYLLAARPVLAHTPRHAFLTSFLEKNGCALVVTEPSEAELSSALDRICNDRDLRQQLVDRGLKTLEPFQARNVANELRSKVGLPIVQ